VKTPSTKHQAPEKHQVPMTETQHLLLCLGEECAEVAQRVSKALRFGLQEVQDGQELTNADRIAFELDDLRAVARILQERRLIPHNHESRMKAKIAKVGAFMDYVRLCRTLEGEATL
jgi:hypothetical protein